MIFDAIFKEFDNKVTVVGLTQWDFGQKLRIIGLDLPNACEVHFGNSAKGEAVVRLAKREGDATLVDIPDSVLRDDHDVRAWVYVIDTLQGKTVKTIILPIEARNKPADFVDPPDPDEEKLINDFIITINKDTAEMKNQVSTVIQENGVFKEDMASDFEDYYLDLKAAAQTNSIKTYDIFLEPSNWVDNEYVIDTTSYGWTLNSQIQPNFNSSMVNMENASMITEFSYTATTFTFKASVNPSEPILATLVYLGEQTGDKMWLEESVGTREIKFYVYEPVPNPDVLFLMNADADTTRGRQWYEDKGPFNLPVTYPETKEQVDNFVNTNNSAWRGSKSFRYKRSTELNKFVLDVSTIDLTTDWLLTSYCIYNVYYSSSILDWLTFLDENDVEIMKAQFKSDSRKSITYPNINGETTTFATASGSDAPAGYTKFTLKLQGDTLTYWRDTVLIVTITSIDVSKLANVKKMSFMGVNENNAFIALDDVVLTRNTSFNLSTSAPYSPMQMGWVEHVKEVTISEPTYFKNVGDKLYKYTNGVWEEVVA